MEEKWQLIEQLLKHDPPTVRETQDGIMVTSSGRFALTPDGKNFFELTHDDDLWEKAKEIEREKGTIIAYGDSLPESVIEESRIYVEFRFSAFQNILHSLHKKGETND